MIWGAETVRCRNTKFGKAMLNFPPLLKQTKSYPSNQFVTYSHAVRTVHRDMLGCWAARLQQHEYKEIKHNKHQCKHKVINSYEQL